MFGTFVLLSKPYLLSERIVSLQVGKTNIECNEIKKN
jgi:hypothetical protein